MFFLDEDLVEAYFTGKIIGFIFAIVLGIYAISIGLLISALIGVYIGSKKYIEYYVDECACPKQYSDTVNSFKAASREFRTFSGEKFPIIAFIGNIGCFVGKIISACVLTTGSMIYISSRKGVEFCRGNLLTRS